MTFSFSCYSNLLFFFSINVFELLLIIQRLHQPRIVQVVCLHFLQFLGHLLHPQVSSIFYYLILQIFLSFFLAHSRENNLCQMCDIFVSLQSQNKMRFYDSYRHRYFISLELISHFLDEFEFEVIQGPEPQI
jgi:hypothetical protein